MTKKRTKKKASAKKALKKKATNPRKGGKKPYKQHGSRGIARSSALAKKAKRERKAKNAAASTKALKTAAKKQFDAVVIPAGVSVPSISNPPPAKAAKAAKAGKAAKPGKKASKKASKKAGKRTAKKTTPAAAPAAAAAAAPKKRRKIGSPSKARRSVTSKFKLMHQWGFPSRRPVTAPKRKALRDAAGEYVTAKQILATIDAEKLKSWVCVGPRRTGCGGGAKNLRGGHQVGIFQSGYAR